MATMHIVTGIVRVMNNEIPFRTSCFSAREAGWTVKAMNKAGDSVVYAGTEEVDSLLPKKKG